MLIDLMGYFYWEDGRRKGLCVLFHWWGM